jgi:hypothetical protein
MLLRYESSFKVRLTERARTNQESSGENIDPQCDRKTGRIRESKGGRPLVLPG